LIHIVIFSSNLVQNVSHVFYGSIDNFAMLCIPLCILMSTPLAASQAGKDLYEAMHHWVYPLPGGLEVSTVLAGGVFG
jgi:TRAP-type mannitol/chloroaromatic compound transport system permease large subunit